MNHINRVVIAGNLTADPELTTDQPTARANFSIGHNTRRKDTATTYKDKANFFNVTAWGSQATYAAKRLKKGSYVLIDGRLEYSQWETPEGKRSNVSIVAYGLQVYEIPKAPDEELAHPPSAAPPF